MAFWQRANAHGFLLPVESVGGGVGGGGRASVLVGSLRGGTGESEKINTLYDDDQAT